MTSRNELSDNDLHSRRVNIIFIRGSVQTCLPFLNSIINLTDLPLRLVSNGCNHSEEQILLTICDNIAQLEFYSLKIPKTIEHGKALDHMLSIEQSDLFSFMDSDVFATDFMSLSEIEPGPGEVAYTSCLPVWHSAKETTMPESYQVMTGQYLESSNGHFFGCSYMASYRIQPLRELVNELGLSFRPYYEKDLSPEILAKLSGLGLNKVSYDTAKIINLLLQCQGHKVSYRPINQLVHIGGASTLCTMRESGPTTYKQTILSLLPLPVFKAIISLLPESVIYMIFHHLFNSPKRKKRETKDYVEFVLRRRQFWEQIEELRRGPPFSKSTMNLIAQEDYAKKIDELFATYRNGDGPIVLPHSP